MVVSVVVQVQDAVQLRLCVDMQLLSFADTLAKTLSCVLLHLDVVELPASKEVLDTIIYDCL